MIYDVQIKRTRLANLMHPSPSEIVVLRIIRRAQMDVFEMMGNDKADEKAQLRIDAALYFGSEMYQLHCEMLGLDATWLPHGITQQLLTQIIEGD